jgi:NAD(P)H-dependent FMN reductase
MIHASKILVIAGSVRARRIAPQIAQWVAAIGRTVLSDPVEVIDLKDWHLPMDDEPGIPEGHPYEREHTKAWAAKIAEAKAIVFVTPQYNWGYPAPLKNAIDHLYKEWSGKPAMIVTYGGHGGTRCAAQLRQVLGSIGMKPVATMPALKLARPHIEANTGAIDAAAVFAKHEPAIRKAFGELQRRTAPSGLVALIRRLVPAFG